VNVAAQGGGAINIGAGTSCSVNIGDSSTSFVRLFAKNARGISIGGSYSDPEILFSAQTNFWGFSTVSRHSFPSPVGGTLCYDNDLKKFCYYNGTNWRILTETAENP
jgi:hypothetical protein